jgi:hypothetical protein
MCMACDVGHIEGIPIRRERDVGYIAGIPILQACFTFETRLSSGTCNTNVAIIYIVF